MTAVRTPLSNTTALELGHKLWKKEIIREGTIHYRGGTFDASPDYLDSVVAAFQDRAVGSVPFVFVDDKGSHSEAPERRKGNVVGLERTPTGIDAILALDDDADDLVTKDRKFGVSVLIKHDRTTGDGKQYPAVLAHVAGTYDPVINTLGDWTELEASNDAGEVLDLLALTSAPTPPGDRTVADTLTPEELTALRSLLAKLDAPSDPAAPVVEPADDVAAEPDNDEAPEELAARTDESDDELTEDQINEIVASVLEPEPELIAASNDGDDALRLANELDAVRRDNEDKALRLAQLETKVAEKDFLAERDHLAREYGIAPRLTDIVAPLLKGSGNTVALSNGDSVDAGELVRRFVKELSAAGFLDLSHPQGSVLDVDDNADEVNTRNELAALAVQQLKG